MEVRSGKYQDYQTIRQWAKQGFLPKTREQGIELWANARRQNSYTYFSPNQVEPASEAQLHAFLQDERERRNRRARYNRQHKKEQALLEQKRYERTQLEQTIQASTAPYQSRIVELCQIIAALTEQLRPEVASGPSYIIDTETTGLDSFEDELLQCTILDMEGNVAYNSYFKPHAASWPEAEAVNHITPQMVQDAPSISEEIITISAILSGASTIIGYNPGFDLDFLQHNGVIISNNAEIIDVMELFAPVYGEWDEEHESYRWKTLACCASYYGYDWGGNPEHAHDSLADCRATLYCYKRIIEDENSSITA